MGKVGVTNMYVYFRSIYLILFKYIELSLILFFRLDMYLNYPIHIQYCFKNIIVGCKKIVQ